MGADNSSKRRGQAWHLALYGFRCSIAHREPSPGRPTRTADAERITAASPAYEKR